VLFNNYNFILGANNEEVEEDGNRNFLGALVMLPRHNEVLKSHLEELAKVNKKKRELG